MNPNWFGLFCAALSLIAFFISYHWGRKCRPQSKGLTTFLLMLSAIPGVSFTLYYAHLVQVPAWYFEFRSWRGIELCLVLIGTAGGWVAARVGPLTRIPLLITVTALVSIPFMKPFLAPMKDVTIHDRWNNGVCLQSTYFTCGPASAASILSQYGVPEKEITLAHEAHTYQGGTEIWYLARSLRSRGYKALMNQVSGTPPFLQTSTQETSTSLPAIVGVKYHSQGHFIAILSRDGDHFHVGDPMRGSETLTREELLDRYAYSGFWMTVKK